MDLYSLLLTLGLANVLIAFLSATVSRSWIPWLIALLWKKPISRKFVAGLSVFFALSGFGSTYAPLLDDGLPESYASLMGLATGATVFCACYFVSVAILRRRHMLSGEV